MRFTLLLTLPLLFFACGSEPDGEMVTESDPVTTARPETPTAQDAEMADGDISIITDESFFDVELGETIAESSIADHKGRLPNGEGVFTVWFIRGKNGQQLGYVTENPNDPGTIGTIYVTTQDARYQDTGLGLGSTWREVRGRYPGIQVYGSEVEGRTVARQGNVGFQLNVANTSYEIDESRIPDNTRVVAIILNTPTD